MSPKKRIAKFLFDRYFGWRLDELMAPQFPVVLEYPVNPQPRYGYGKPPHPELYKLMNDSRARYNRSLRSMLGIRNLSGVSRSHGTTGMHPQSLAS